MSSAFSKLMASPYFRVTLSAAIIFFGIAGGIYVGFIFVDRLEPELTTAAANSIPSYQSTLEDSGYSLSFGQGDLFPLEPCYLVDSTLTDFEELLNGSPALLLFGSPGCGPCDDVKNILDNLPSLQTSQQPAVYFLIGQHEFSEKIALVDLNNERYKYIQYDEPFFRTQYNLKVLPTLVAVDKHGFVVHSQIGFVDGIENQIHDFIEDNN